MWESFQFSLITQLLEWMMVIKCEWHQESGKNEFVENRSWIALADEGRGRKGKTRGDWQFGGLTNCGDHSPVLR